MPEKRTIKLPLKRQLAMIGSWAGSRAMAQLKAIAFVAVYVALAQILVLRIPVQNAVSVALGLTATVAGLAFFLEGLFLGVMPLGERCGTKLPGQAGPILIAAFALILGATATLAEPAVGILKTQGGSVKAWDAPLLFLLLNRGSNWLVAAIAAGVGVAVALGVFRFLYGWPFKPFVLVIIPVLAAATFVADGDPNLRAVIGLAWDTGGVTTGPVTVPLVIALGIGVSRIVGAQGDDSGGLGVVTLASALPVAAVLALAAALLPMVPAPTDARAFFSEAERGRAVFVAGSEEALAAMAAAAVHSGSLSADDYAAGFGPEPPPAPTRAEGSGGGMLDYLLSALKAVLPLALVLVVTLVFLLRDKLRDVDEIILGLCFAVVGMFLFGYGMEKGLAELGRQAGRNLPRAYEATEREDRAVILRDVGADDPFAAKGAESSAEYLWIDGRDGPTAIPFDRAAWDEASGEYRYVPVDKPVFGRWGEYGGLAAVLAFVFVLGFGATLAEPSLQALGATIEDLTTGTYKGATLVKAVALGVGVGMAVGFAAILWDLPLSWVLGVPYAVALLLTIFSSEDFAAIAWDSAGVTTGPITVPLVIATGLGIGTRGAAVSSFGVVAASSVFPIVAVLLTGLARKARSRAEWGAEAGGQP